MTDSKMSEKSERRSTFVSKLFDRSTAAVELLETPIVKS